MEKYRQEEYDFFIRAAMLFEEKMIALAHLEDDILVAPTFRRYRLDAANAREWAGRIQAGYVLVQPKEAENSDTAVVDRANVPDKYR